MSIGPRRRRRRRPPSGSAPSNSTPRTRWPRYRDHFIGTDTDLSYLDGNSLGRPLKRTVTDIGTFIQDSWGGRLIRGWDEEWLELPQAIGDQLGRAVLGAAPGRPSSPTPPPWCSTS